MLEAQAYEGEPPDIDHQLAMCEINSLTEWLDHPLKRLKAADNDDADSRQQRHQGPLPSSRATAGDPYEFDDDVSAGKLRSYNANAQPGTAIKDEFQVKVEAKVSGLHCVARHYSGRDVIGFMCRASSRSTTTRSTSWVAVCGRRRSWCRLTWRCPTRSSTPQTTTARQTTSRRAPSTWKYERTCQVPPLSLEVSRDISLQRQTSSERGGKMVPGGLAADSEHAALANSYPTPPTHENQQHTLSPGMDFTDASCSLTAFGDSTLNIKVSLVVSEFALHQLT